MARRYDKHNPHHTSLRTATECQATETNMGGSKHSHKQPSRLTVTHYDEMTLNSRNGFISKANGRSSDSSHRYDSSLPIMIHDSDFKTVVILQSLKKRIETHSSGYCRRISQRSLFPLQGQSYKISVTFSKKDFHSFRHREFCRAAARISLGLSQGFQKVLWPSSSGMNCCITKLPG